MDAILNLDLANEESAIIKKLFDSSPYPKKDFNGGSSNGLPFKKNPSLCREYNVKYAFYLKNKVVKTKEKIKILDLACGSGYTTACLAEINPNAEIIGLDFSHASIEVAKKKLVRHKQNNNISFIVGDILKLDTIFEDKFDYINCSDAHYLIPDPELGFKKMKSVLNRYGIIRTNFHCKYQREEYYRIQEVFKTIGLLSNVPGSAEIRQAKDFLNLLSDELPIKRAIWNESLQDKEDEKEMFLMNHLFFGDKGSDFKEIKKWLSNSDLDLISTTNPVEWKIEDLFFELPDCLESFLERASEVEKVYLCELLNPSHRLLDFWCCIKGEINQLLFDEDEDIEAWEEKEVHVFDFVKTQNLYECLTSHVIQNEIYEITKNVLLTPLMIAGCFLPLWDSNKTVKELLNNLRSIKPLDYLTLEKSSDDELFFILKAFIKTLVLLGYGIVDA